MERFENCLYKDICDYEIECSKACIRYSVTKYMLEKSNIPKNKWGINILTPEDCDIRAFEALSEIRNSIIEFTENGSSLYIYSTNCGNGKTTWATKLMLQYFNDVWEHTGYNSRGAFIHIPTFLYNCKASISRPDEEFEELKNSLFSVDLVVWDDIGAAKISDYDFNIILSIIDSRIYKGKSNIYTGNLLPNELDKHLGSKLASRILEGAKIQLRGGDRRNGRTTNSFSNINI